LIAIPQLQYGQKRAKKPISDAPVARPEYTPAMAQAARTQQAHDDVPPVDPYAVDRAYRLERAKRRARAERQRASRHAAIRFFVTLLLLLALSVALVIVVWRQVQDLFGL
jgi:hypothetical protein